MLPYLRRGTGLYGSGACGWEAVIAVPPKGIVFDVDHGAYGRWAVVHVTGDLDWTRSASLLDTVERLWDHLRDGCLILDLGPLRFCDSSGISRVGPHTAVAPVASYL
ncbi:STAS domain-containing protein [Microbispora sp. H13382]|uniref:STAS domain-containing protein n=1 Tax=Microbispora sp. H13382 TaxID=2729112 RepID=UPI0037C773BA